MPAAPKCREHSARRALLGLLIVQLRVLRLTVWRSCCSNACSIADPVGDQITQAAVDCHTSWITNGVTASEGDTVRRSRSICKSMQFDHQQCTDAGSISQLSLLLCGSPQNTAKTGIRWGWYCSGNNYFRKVITGDTPPPPPAARICALPLATGRGPRLHRAGSVPAPVLTAATKPVGALPYVTMLSSFWTQTNGKRATADEGLFQVPERTATHNMSVSSRTQGFARQHHPACCVQLQHEPAIQLETPCGALRGCVGAHSDLCWRDVW